MKNKNKEFEVTLCIKHRIIIYPGVIRRKVITQIDKKSKSQFFFF